MRLLFSFLLIAFFSTSSFANITKDNEYLLNRSGSGYFKAQLGTLVNQTRNLLVAKYSYAVQGGTTSDLVLLTDLTNSKSYASLPANAIITNVYYNVLTQPTSNGAATVALKAESAADLLSATAVTAGATWGTGFRQGVPTGATTTFLKTTASRQIKATVATEALSAGRFDVFIEWVLGSGS